LAAEDSDLPGCLVLDVQMPELNGIDLQARLLSNLMPRPIVFISGKSDIPTSVKAMKYGAVDFLTKPIARDELIAAVQHALLKAPKHRTTARGWGVCHKMSLAVRARQPRFLARGEMGKKNKKRAGHEGNGEMMEKIQRGGVMTMLGLALFAKLGLSSPKLVD